jgi:hypothetical protein
MTEASAAAVGAPPPTGILSRRGVLPALLFLVLMGIYASDGTTLPVRDAIPNLCLAVQVLKTGGLSFSPQESPFMFVWTLQGAGGSRKVDVDAWDAEVEGRRAEDLFAIGILSDPQPRYYLAPSVREGRYVGIYGPGAGLSAVPYFAAISLVYGGWSDNLGILGAEAKVFASACVAGAAVLLYATFLLYLPRPVALVAAVLFGLGTCVWAELTRALWQQSPAILFVATSLYLLARSPGRWSFAAAAGFCSGAAVLCRPTLGLLLLGAGGYLIWKSRREALPFALAAAIPLLTLAGYNAFYLGSPFRMGQSEAARKLALSISGSGDIWQTPLWEGGAGVLFSPSRGLFAFSPFLAFTGWGMVEAWRRPGFEMFRAWSLALAALLLIAFKWFEWFGGWVYGYRLVAELAPLLMVFLIPVAQRIRESTPLSTVFAILAAGSVGIQVLGASRYDPVAWNGRQGFEIRVHGEEGTRVLTDEESAVRLVEAGRAAPVKILAMDVAQPRFRYRLWSLSDSQLAWLLRPEAADLARDSRKRMMAGAVKEKMRFPVP